MDIAQRLELQLIEKQKPMNAAIDRGDSPVQQFYRDTVIFLTGGSGFLGKQLIEKLFRSCDIKKLYMLLRPKKGKTIQQRLSNILKDPLYDSLRKKKPNFAQYIVPVEGDVANLRVGLSDKDWNNISNEVNIIIHLAATVNFDEPLQVAGLINVRGTREVLQLARNCQHLKLFNHVSTAFAHATTTRVDCDVSEEFYPSPLPPDVFLEMVDSIDKERLNSITPALIKDWPNTYTFTKAIAEELVRIHAGDLPVCIVKPPVVLNSLTEPTPGWIDLQTAMASPCGFLLGVGMGVVHTLLVDWSVPVNIAPLDYVNNAIIAAGWDSVTNRELCSNIPMYTVSSSPNNYTWGEFRKLLQTDEFLRLCSPRALWYCCCLETNNKQLYWLLTWVLHYIPGYFVDAMATLLGVRPKGMPSLVKIYTKIYKLTMVYRYFMANNWNFRDDNLVAMISRLSPADKVIYNCDITTVNFKELVIAMCLGTRRFIIRDGLQGSDVAYRRQQWFFYANILFLGFYAYLIWKVLYFVYSIFALMLNV